MTPGESVVLIRADTVSNIIALVVMLEKYWTTRQMKGINLGWNVAARTNEEPFGALEFKETKILKRNGVCPCLAVAICSLGANTAGLGRRNLPKRMFSKKYEKMCK
jgi:hypothetical protein